MRLVLLAVMLAFAFVAAAPPALADTCVGSLCLPTPGLEEIGPDPGPCRPYCLG